MKAGVLGSWSHYLDSQEAEGDVYFWSACCAVQRPSLLNSTTPIKGGFVYFIHLILKIPHRYSQEDVSMVILNPVMLTIKMEYHMAINR